LAIDEDRIALDTETAYVLNPSLRVVRCSDDELLVKHGTRALFSEIVSDDERRRLLGRIADRLRRPASFADLEREGLFGPDEAEDARQIVGYLQDRGVLCDASDSLAQVYLDTILGGTPRLRNAAVAVLGSGAMARQIAARVAELEPGRLLLAAERPLALEPAGATEVVASELDLTDDGAIRTAIEGVGLAIAALDAWSPRALHAVNAAAITARTAWMPAFFDGGEAIVGPTCVPGETSCYFEYEIQQEASLGLRDEYHLFKEALADEGPEPAATLLPPFVDIAAGLAVTAALKFLATGRVFTVNRVVHVDVERGSIDYQEVFRLPRCPACAGLRPPQRHLFL
jgi:bacteriocin biosynthesis cyclodehydratase domain-containing protein